MSQETALVSRGGGRSPLRIRNHRKLVETRADDTVGESPLMATGLLSG